MMNLEESPIAFYGPETSQMITSVELQAEVFSLSDKELLELFREIQNHIIENNNEKEIN